MIWALVVLSFHVDHYQNPGMPELGRYDSQQDCLEALSHPPIWAKTLILACVAVSCPPDQGLCHCPEVHLYVRTP